MDLTLIVVVVGGLVLGLVLLNFIENAVKSRLASVASSDVQQVMEQLETGALIPLTVEVDGEWYLCYNSITKDFVCQGRDLTEIIERFNLRFPSKGASIYDGDEQAVTKLKQQLKDKNEGINCIRPAS